MSSKRCCTQCGIKISLVDSIMCKCRCNNVFCKIHRLDHICKYDYQEEYKTNNCLVKLEEKKLDKI